MNLGMLGVSTSTSGVSNSGSSARSGKKKKVIRLYDADRETTAQFLKEQLRAQFPEPLKEIQEKKQKQVIVARNKREAKMREEHEKEEARQKAEVLKMNNAILQLIALAHDA